MEALYLLVPLSIGVVFAAIWAFFWMSDNGQFDDMVGPGLRVLEDDEDAVASPATWAAPPTSATLSTPAGSPTLATAPPHTWPPTPALPSVFKVPPTLSTLAAAPMLASMPAPAILPAQTAPSASPPLPTKANVSSK